MKFSIFVIDSSSSGDFVPRLPPFLDGYRMLSEMVGYLSMNMGSN